MAETHPGAIGLAVKLPFATPEEFISKYGNNVTRGGIFLRAKAVKPPGTPITLELRLANGDRIIYASGVVHFVTGQRGEGVSGMGVRFLSVDADTQKFLDERVAVLPHGKLQHPPLPAGVGEADYRIPSNAPMLAPTPGAPSPVSTAPQFPASPPSAPPPAATAQQYTVSPGTPAAPHLVQGLQAAAGVPAPAPSSAPAASAPARTAAAPPPSLGSNPGLTAPPFEPPPEEPKRTGPIIGIDLGTTNSCASFVRQGKASILKSREGYNTVPSIIALSPKGKLVVGHPAKNQMLTNPRLTVYGAKRLVGRPYESQIVQQIKDRFHYEIASDNGEAAVKLADRVYSLQQISAMILREVREGAQNQLGQPVSRAVITVPAYYNDNQRHAVREAGRLAGLHVERILNEPTAAALAYGYGRNLKQRVLVYDLGGGTFDASVLELAGNVYEVISTGGDTFLGGIDFDNAIVAHLLSEFQVKTARPFQGDRVALQRITDAAERAKCALSERSEIRVHVPFITMVDSKPYDLDVTLTREQLIQLTSGLVERTLKVCEEVLKAKDLKPQDIHEVILVGGQSRFPLVHEKITQFFGKAPSKGAHPDEAVATGAALLAHSLGQLEGVVLIDVLPMAIGIGLPGGRFKPVLERNSPLPAMKKYILATNRDNQTDVEISVFQGESAKALENEYLGTMKLTGLPKGPRGSVSVEVAFEVSNESLLKVTAKEVATGREVTSAFSTKKDVLQAKGRTGQTGEYPPATTPVATPAVSAPSLKLAPLAKDASGAAPAAPAAAAPSAAHAPGLSPEVAAAEAKSGGLFGWFKRLFGRG